MIAPELQAMRDEIEKLAGPSGVLRSMARFATESAGHGALVGGGLGAALGAYRDRSQGGSGWRGALAGGVAGAGLGAAAGGLGRAYRDTKLLNPALSNAQAVGATGSRMAEGLKRFGRRQVHGFTGRYADQPGAMGMGNARAYERANLEYLRFKDLAQHAKPGELAAKAPDAAARIKHIYAEGSRSQGMLNAGITNLPGIAKALTGPNRGQTAKQLWHAATGGSRLGTTAAVGIPAAAGALDLARGDESSKGGLTKMQKVRNLGVTTGAGLLTGGLPILPQLATITATESLLHKKPRGPHVIQPDLA